MVNYCCVKGCLRNSRAHPNLTYYSLPREKERQSQWLKAAHREDLLKGPDLIKPAHRICSRHFDVSLFKNRNRLLGPTAAPTLCLDGEERDEDYVKPLIHDGFACDNCQGAILGFRYKCIECDNYDLCHKCEVNEYHSEHFVLRIPRPNAVNKSNNLSKILKKELQIQPQDSESSDDEPIHKYIAIKQNGRPVTNENIIEYYSKNENSIELNKNENSIELNKKENSIELDRNVKRMLQKHVNRAFERFTEDNKGICRRNKRKRNCN